MWIFQDLPLAFTEGMLRLIRRGAVNIPMMLPLYNDEICPEENEIGSLDLISDHRSGLYSPPNVG